MFRQFEVGRLGTAASTDIVARGQGNQIRSITLPAGNTRRSGDLYCQTCGYSHYGRCGRSGVCFRCGQTSHMKRDCPLNVSRPAYGAIAPPSVVALTHTIGSVAQPVGRGITSRGAQSGMRGQITGGRG